MFIKSKKNMIKQYQYLLFIETICRFGYVAEDV